MSGIKRLNKAGFVLLASLMMTTALPAYAQDADANLPEVEVDGSVLQQLDPSAGNTQSLSPIALVPPPSLNRQATSNSGPTLTDTFELDPSGEKDVAINHDARKDFPSIVPPPEHVVVKAIVPLDTPPEPLEIQPIQSVTASQTIAEQIPSPIKDKAQKSAEEDHESFLHHFVTAPVKSLLGSSKKSDLALAPPPAPPIPAVAPIVASVSEPDLTPASITKAGTVSSKPTDLANEDRPAIIPQKKVMPPVNVAKAKLEPKVDLTPVTTLAAVPVAKPAASLAPKADSNFVTEVVMDVPGVPMPTAPLTPVLKKIAAAAPPVAPKSAVSKAVDDEEDLTAPPQVMAETAGLKAAVTKPVLFPISSKSKTKGDMNPAITASTEAKTPIAPVIPQPETTKALNTAMSDQSVVKHEQIAVAVAEPKQQAPDVLYHNVPVPKPRPNVIVASKDFVEQARRTYEDTYKVVKRDGDQMPAVGAQKVSKEDLPPVRMSVADIATDPLARKLVAMTPDDIASTLNGMTPAAGGNAQQDTSSRIVDESVGTNKHIRIVRENGNWTPRKPAAVQTVNADGTQEITPPSADGHYNIAFQSGATDLPATSFGEIDSGVINALRADSNARVQIVAYASAADGKDTTAKRTSLARALSLRSYMISKGIDATRMDVRAIGIQQDANASADQVQMIIVPQDAKKT